MREIYTANCYETLGKRAFYDHGEFLVGRGNFGQIDEHGREVNKDMGIIYKRLGQVYDFFLEIYNYKIYDGSGSKIKATAHFGSKCADCFYDPDSGHLVFGDGDELIAANFVNALDIIAHEMTHGVIAHTSNLEYCNESGALNEHLADVFGVLCAQFYVWRTQCTYDVRTAQWTIGSKAFGGTLSIKDLKDARARRKQTPRRVHPGELAVVRGDWDKDEPGRVERPKLLRSMADPTKGLLPQPKSYHNWVESEEDEDGDYGGVHTNSGIPNYAFYKAATQAGGKPWEGVGKVWFHAMTCPQLGADCDFARFAAATIYYSSNMSAKIRQAVVDAWRVVGVEPDESYAVAAKASQVAVPYTYTHGPQNQTSPSYLQEASASEWNASDGSAESMSPAPGAYTHSHASQGIYTHVSSVWLSDAYQGSAAASYSAVDRTPRQQALQAYNSQIAEYEPNDADGRGAESHDPIISSGSNSAPWRQTSGGHYHQ